MLGKTHLLMGVFLGLLLWFLPLSILQKVLVLVFCIFGSLFPDIDTPKSIIGRKVKLVGWLFRHRGFFHGIVALILFTSIIILLSNVLYGFSFALGFLSHLLLDSLSIEGVNIFGKKFRGRFKVGGFVEKGFQIILITGIIIIFFYTF